MARGFLPKGSPAVAEFEKYMRSFLKSERRHFYSANPQEQIILDKERWGNINWGTLN
jgi:hypothetical protein